MSAFFRMILLLLVTATPALAKVKNLILVIGDGMGPQQLSLLYYYTKYAKSKDPRAEKYIFETLANQGTLGISATEPFGNIVVDSACSATQLALGTSSRSEMIGLNKDGDSDLTILQKAKKKGMATAIVTDTRVTHATPASFAAHAANRHIEPQIAEGIIKTQPDVILGGGAEFFLPSGPDRELAPGFFSRSKRADKKDLITRAKSQGYQVAFNLEQMNQITSGPILGLFSQSGMPDAIWQTQQLRKEKRSTPNLLDMTKKTLEIVSKNKKGSFAMIEAGQIDWAAHANDAGTMLHELITINEVVGWLKSYVDKNPDTLLVVTADHETGGFGFGYNVGDLPSGKKLRGSYFSKTKFKPIYDYGKFTVLDKLYRQKSSNYRMLKKFGNLPKQRQTAENLQKIVSESISFDFNIESARRVLQEEKNPFYNPKFKSAKSPTLPAVGGNRSFYFNQVGTRSALISQGYNSQSNVVWGTGGHTSTPVYVFAYGAPEHHVFKGFHSHPKVGRLLQSVLGL